MAKKVNPFMKKPMTAPVPPMTPPVPKPMSPEALAKRKRSTVSNAASKVMGGLYSK